MNRGEAMKGKGQIRQKVEGCAGSLEWMLAKIVHPENTDLIIELSAVSEELREIVFLIDGLNERKATEEAEIMTKGFLESLNLPDNSID